MASKIIATLVGLDNPPTGGVLGSGFTGGITASSKKSATLAPGGTLDNQFDPVISVKSTLAPSGVIAFDFGSDLDRYGVGIAATDVLAMMIENKGQPGVTPAGTLHVEPNIADPWTSFISATGGTDRGRLVLPPDTGFMMWGLVAGTYAVGGGNDRLDIVEASTTDPVDVEATILLRR